MIRLCDIRVKSKTPTISVLILASVAALAGCGGGASSSATRTGTQGSFYTGGAPGGTPVSGGTVTIDSSEAPSSLDPVISTVPGDERAFESLYDTVTEILPGSNEPQPGLASSWTTSSDGLTYTFHIRSGVTFSNGEPLTGEDVAYSLLRSKNAVISTCKTFTTDWHAVSLEGPMTVKLQLTKPDPTLVGELTLWCFGIVPKHVVQRESESHFAQHPVGTGPFVLKSATPGNTTVAMVRNPHYWRAGQPYLDGLVLNQVESDNARVLAVRSGAANVAMSIPYSQAPGLKATPGVRMLIEPLWGASLNAINDTKPPLSEVNVRRALMYATPFSAIIKSVYKGLASQTSAVWGNTKYWDSNVPIYKYDLAKARELLKTTSVSHGFSVTIQCTGGETVGELTAAILQSSWAKIGIHVTVDSIQSTALFSNLFSGKYEVGLLPPESGVDIMFDPGPNSVAYLAGEGFPSIAPSSRLKAQLGKAFATQDQSARQKLYREIQYESYWKEPSWIPIINLAALSLVGDSLRGYQILPDGHIPVQQIWLAH